MKVGYFDNNSVDLWENTLELDIIEENYWTGLI